MTNAAPEFILHALHLYHAGLSQECLMVDSGLGYISCSHFDELSLRRTDVDSVLLLPRLAAMRLCLISTLSSSLA